MPNPAAPTFARLLSARCLAAILGVTITSLGSGCALDVADCIANETSIEDLVAPTESDLLGLIGDDSSMVAVGRAGTLLQLVGAANQWTAIATPSDADLFALANFRGSTADTIVDRTILVGASGTVLVSEQLASPSALDLGTDADLFAITLDQTRAAIVGDGVAFASMDAGSTWQPATLPEGVGELHGVFDQGEVMVALGRAGAILVSADAGLTWASVASPTDADLWAIGRSGGAILIVGDAGTILRFTWTGEASVELVANQLGGSGDLRGLSDTIAVGREGLIVDLGDGGGKVISKDPARGDLFAVVSTPYEGESQTWAVGAAGRTTTLARWTYVKDKLGCEGITPGRPLRIAGAARLAPVCDRSDWQQHATPQLEGLSPALRRELATAWTRDAQLEHASIAAFARHALELLALGAPPELVRETAAAQLDEVEHARLCFGLASAYAGRSIGPGPLDLDGLTARGLVIEPLAVARELFESGCLNETFAALEAARAAELADDPHVVELLERIADDEARHAALAWKTLAWLAGRSMQVEAWLRVELGRLGASSRDPGHATPALARHGRLPEHARLRVQADAITTIVRPALRVLCDRARPTSASQVSLT